MKPIRVFVVDHQGASRAALHRCLQGDSRLDVVAALDKGGDAARLITRLMPQVIVWNWQPSSVAILSSLVSQAPLPIVALCDDPAGMESLALAAGAVSTYARLSDAGDSSQAARQLCDHVVAMSRVRVIRRRLPASGNLRVGGYRVVGIVASTGGPTALAKVLNALPRDFGAPILVVQHITEQFSQGFSAWLNEQVELPVQLAEDGQETLPGHVYLAPSGHHLTWDGLRNRLDDGPPIKWQRPSGTRLLHSLARHGGSQAVGVLLTGIGDDGAAGLLEIRRAGGYTLSQDRSTSVVYGMPAAARALAGVTEELPLGEIGPRIHQLLARGH